MTAAVAPIELTTQGIRISRIRLRNRQHCVFFGHPVDLDNKHTDRSRGFVVKIPANLIQPETFTVGEIWQVHGEASEVTRTIDGFTFTETQINAIDVLMLKPSGSQLIQWLRDKVTGIGEVKAQRLWDVHSEDLYRIMDNELHDKISPQIPSEDVRATLFEEWLKHGDASTLKFVQNHAIPLELARKAIKFHKKETIGKLIDDPYRLLSFTGKWRLVDSLAQREFNLKLDDPRRLSAALEEALYGCVEHGHTCQSLDDLQANVTRLLKPLKLTDEHFYAALKNGEHAGQFMVSQQGSGFMLHACGMWVMEKAVAQFINTLQHLADQQLRLFSTDIDQVIAEFEQSERHALSIPEFSLNEAQREAVKTSFSNKFSVITGGAGVGKTTVLKALYKALDHLGQPRFQMALSGRATARMIEATHEPATTIAGFLRNVKAEEMGDSPIVVIDEASMLDLTTFYRLTRKLPQGTHLILVGDPYQLPPIGAGLILHLLCNMPSIPSTELTVVKRQASTSDIPVVSKNIRDGIWPDLSNDVMADVVFIPCSDKEIIPHVLSLYEEDRERTQILSATKSCRFAGVNALNQECHNRYVSRHKLLTLMNNETDELESTGFREGDLILYTANDWDRNLQNGCLGQLTLVYDQPAKVDIGTEESPDIRTSLGKAVYEGVEHYVLDTDIDVMELAYCITVHKSQGSQFERVIVPVRKSRVLDRTFIYTAVTRAQRQVILVGNTEVAKQAVEALPRSFERKVGLGSMLVY